MPQPSPDLVPWQHADAEHAATVFVIAEIGVNHDGDPALAQQLIQAAAKAGADGVKFQLFQPARLLSAEAALATYQDGKAQDAHALLENLCLHLDAFKTLRTAAHDVGLWFIVTPFSVEDVTDLAALEVDAVKIASPDAVNTPLLDAAATLNKPAIISTGPCALEELGPATHVAQSTDGALLQCVSAYPTPEPDAAMGGITAMRQRWGATTGYSDHTPALDSGALAVAQGACILEKHLTHDRSAPGPDHAASLEPDALGRYIAAARRAAMMVGPVRKSTLPIEQDVRRVSRQSVCTTTDLPAGHVLRATDLTVKRPGIGLPAAVLNDIPGRVLARAVRCDHALRDTDLK